jgi:dihydrofolate reductase
MDDMNGTRTKTADEELSGDGPDLARIVLIDNVSLDGVMQDPAGDEGFPRGGWVGLIQHRLELNQLALDDALGAGAFLMGRRTYDWFAARWPSRSGALAERLNAMPKYVLSSTVDQLAWTNSTVLRGDAIDEVSRLRREIAGDIMVPASVRLARALLEADLVDELRLKVFPVVIGAGERLFGETSDTHGLRLVETRTIDGDTAYLRYGRGQAVRRSPDVPDLAAVARSGHQR